MEVSGSGVEVNGRKKNRSIEDIEDNKENIKRKYLDNVLLSDTEYNKLIEKY
jgi:hypothetical protein